MAQIDRIAVHGWPRLKRWYRRCQKAAYCPDNRDTFIDGDTLVCSLEPGLDLCRRVNRVLEAISRLGPRKLRHVLIDCMDLPTIKNGQLRVFVTMHDELRVKNIELLILDAPQRLLAALAPSLPRAVWIDSERGTRSASAQALAPKHLL